MKILMFGWEFPPFSQGGLGTACQGLVHGLLAQKAKVFLVLPHNIPVCAQKNNLVFVNPYEFLYKKHNLQVFPVDSTLLPYSSPEQYNVLFSELAVQAQNNEKALYGKDLFAEVERYTAKATDISEKIDHDVIHSHDWMTYPAGEIAREKTDNPLIVHVHATEFDRTGGNPNQQIYDLERRGLHKADRIIAVSNYTKQKIVDNYGISEDKVDVVHNAVKHNEDYFNKQPHLNKTDKIVLFLGRITLQKGPEYFVDMAAKVLKKFKKVKFVMAGSGDMMNFVIQRAASLGIDKHFLFTGFLQPDEVDRVYQMADLYVMPSVSEPFGITPLESIRNGTPVMISKQSGVSEVIVNALKVDFWDIDELANKTLAVLSYPALPKTLIRHSAAEVRSMSWAEQAGKVKEVYERCLLVS